MTFVLMTNNYRTRYYYIYVFSTSRKFVVASSGVYLKLPE